MLALGDRLIYLIQLLHIFLTVSVMVLVRPESFFVIPIVSISLRYFDLAESHVVPAEPLSKLPLQDDNIESKVAVIHS